MLLAGHIFLGTGRLSVDGRLRAAGRLQFRKLHVKAGPTKQIGLGTQTYLGRRHQTEDAKDLASSSNIG